jgi:ribonuclease Z
LQDISEGVVYQANGVKVTAFDMDHGIAIKPALGYRIDYGRRSILVESEIIEWSVLLDSRQSPR